MPHLSLKKIKKRGKIPPGRPSGQSNLSERKLELDRSRDLVIYQRPTPIGRAATDTGGGQRAPRQVRVWAARITSGTSISSFFPIAEKPSILFHRLEFRLFKRNCKASYYPFFPPLPPLPLSSLPLPLLPYPSSPFPFPLFPSSPFTSVTGRPFGKLTESQMENASCSFIHTHPSLISHGRVYVRIRTRHPRGLGLRIRSPAGITYMTNRLHLPPPPPSLLPLPHSSFSLRLPTYPPTPPSMPPPILPLTSASLHFPLIPSYFSFPKSLLSLDTPSPFFPPPTTPSLPSAYLFLLPSYHLPLPLPPPSFYQFLPPPLHPLLQLPSYLLLLPSYPLPLTPPYIPPSTPYPLYSSLPPSSLPTIPSLPPTTPSYLLPPTTPSLPPPYLPLIYRLLNPPPRTATATLIRGNEATLTPPPLSLPASPHLTITCGLEQSHPRTRLQHLTEGGGIN
ncbi:hypothetical protein C7M84_000430 [Penaeus vannamei]|uniref:Uncharacterized protein n=1 Tax=Penaeus vannamei TaxID=6689 RepID=A0A3R7N9E8_PENVA|nr:hypothetical protein C7M84_000430 [Penaeus vannamei]